MERDDDIVMLGKDIFTVARLKELLSENTKQLLEKTGNNNDFKGQYFNLLQNYEFASISFLLFRFCSHLYITDKSNAKDLSKFRVILNPEGNEAQLFKPEIRTWISGKIRIQADLEIIEEYSINILITLEFASDHINTIISDYEEKGLDDLRAKLNQINPS